MRIRSRIALMWHAIFPDRLPALLASAGFLLVLVLTYEVFAQQPLISGDLSTYLLPTHYRQSGFGTLYADIFDIKAPLIYAAVALWASVAGSSLVGFWAMYAVWLALTATAFWLLLRRISGPWLALAVSASACLVLTGFTMLEEILVTTEVLGAGLALWGLYLGLRAAGSWSGLAAGAALLGAAGQVKEVFLLAPVALLPAILDGRRLVPRRLVAVVVGWGTALLVTALSLRWWGAESPRAYLEILAFKRERFPAPSASDVSSRAFEQLQAVATWLPLVGVMILALLVTALASARSRRGRATTAAAPDGNADRIAALLLLAAVGLGSLWQGAPLVLHYALAVIPPLFLALASAITWGLRASANLGQPLRPLLAAALVAGLLPAPAAIAWSAGRTTSASVQDIVQAASTLESPADLSVFEAIAATAPRSSCIEVAYGWSAPTYSLYSDRPACSRFVVPPLALDPRTRAQKQEQLIARPPAVLVLDPAVREQTALPVSEGTPEDVIFPFEAVASACYRPLQGRETLFVPRADEAATSRCIAERVAEMPATGG